MLDRLVPRLALGVAAIAMIVSSRSCQIAKEAHVLALRQYREERELVLTGEFTKDGDAVKLRSASDSVTFLEGRALFPTEITKDEWPILSSDKTLYLVMAKYGLQQIIEKKIPQENGFMKVSTGGKIPVLVDGYYTSKGEAYLDRSLYLLGVEFVVDDKIGKPPAVKFNGLIFVKHFAPDAWVSREYLDKFMDDEKGFYIPPKSP
jgi:hypothetical protein